MAGRGLYLFAGPVGSGKTTLMHALAQERFADQQVMSIEDPVEIKQDNMLQLQLNDQIGMTYTVAGESMPTEQRQEMLELFLSRGHNAQLGG